MKNKGQNTLGERTKPDLSDPALMSRRVWYLKIPSFRTKDESDTGNIIILYDTAIDVKKSP